MGLEGAKNFLEGKAGLYPVYYRGLSYDINRLTTDIGKRYEVLNIATKPYPCCGFIMAPIENILDVMRKNSIVYKDVKKVVFSVNREMYNTVCSPPDRKYQPKNPSDAMFSLPYVVATAMQQGDVLLSDFSNEAIVDSERLEIARKIEVEIDDEIEAESKELDLVLSLHQIRVDINSGQSFSQKMYYAKGFPQNPMSAGDFVEKIKKCANYSKNSFLESNAEEFKKAVLNLEKENDVRTFLNRFLL